MRLPETKVLDCLEFVTRQHDLQAFCAAWFWLHLHNRAFDSFLLTLQAHNFQPKDARGRERSTTAQPR
jgi:hypothetical protein